MMILANTRKEQVEGRAFGFGVMSFGRSTAGSRGKHASICPQNYDVAQDERNTSKIWKQALVPGHVELGDTRRHSAWPKHAASQDLIF